LTGNADTVTITDNGNVAEDNLVLFMPDADQDGGNYSPESDAGYYYNPNTNTLTVPAIASALTGNATGSSGSCTGNAATVTIADNEATAENNCIMFVPGADDDGGNYAPEADGDFHYNPNTGTVTATILTNGTVAITGGALTGLTTPLTVPQGGMGAASFTDGGILTGNAGGVVNAMTVLADGEILVGDGAAEPTAVVPAMSEFVPIGWFVFDGTTDPGDETEEDNVRYRDFAGTVASEEGEFQWMAPGNLSGSTVKVRAIGLITNATAPANTEGVSWAIAAVSAGGDDSHDLAVGAEANSEDTDLDDQASAQWDLVFFPYVEVTPTNLAAGELVKMSVARDYADGDDTYEQDIGLVGVEIKYIIDLATQTY